MQRCQDQCMVSLDIVRFAKPGKGTVMSQCVAIIPARGSSKRIPDKNIKDFCGKPIIAYSITAALDSGLFDRVIVSTDSQAIADVAIQYGAQVPFIRPVALSNDMVGTVPVVAHALQWLKDQQHPHDHACCIYATAPFVQSSYLRQGLDLIRKTQTHMSFSVTTFAFPILRSLRVNDSGTLEPNWPEYEQYRSQDLPQSYHDAGQFYWYDVKQLLRTNQAPYTGAVPVVLPRYLVQDIDTLEDWQRAQLMYKASFQENA